MTKHPLVQYGVIAALVLGGAAAVWLISSRDTTVAQTATPRTADGTPDFSGVWGGGGGGGGEDPFDEQGNFRNINVARPCHPGQECGPGVNAERDPGMTKRMDPNKPFYKPEYWERVQHLDLNGNAEDLSGHCFPLGVPRAGIPNKVVQTPTELVFLYQRYNTFRVIPIDGRAHDPIRSQDLSWWGDSVGRWEDDTMVIESVGFTDESWLDYPGYLHSRNMRVVERFWREGNRLHRQATVHDPDVLEEPWVMNAQSAMLNPDPNALLQESLPCDERDWEHMAGITKERS